MVGVLAQDVAVEGFGVGEAAGLMMGEGGAEGDGERIGWHGGIIGAEVVEEPRGRSDRMMRW